VKGTKYGRDNIVVTKIMSNDIIEIGVIQKIVVRGEELLLLLSMHHCARHRFRFFEALPLNEVKVVNFRSLKDFKPLLRLGNAECFRFFLHHHVPIQN
jgi:hypothetical protein